MNLGSRNNTNLRNPLSGVTTLVGGGTGPAHGTCATTCTPSPEQMRLMLQATDELPLNIGFTGKVQISCLTSMGFGDDS